MAKRMSVRELLETIQQSLVRIESSIALVVAKQKTISSDGVAVPISKSILGNPAPNIAKLTRNKRITLPLPANLAKSVIGIFKTMEVKTTTEFVIPSDVDRVLLLESLRYLASSHKGREFLISIEKNKAAVSRIS